MKRLDSYRSKEESAYSPNKAISTKHSVDSSDNGLDLNKLQEIAPIKAQYSLDLNEQYYDLLEYKSECYFQFIDFSQLCLLLYLKSDQTLLQWATQFKRHCINTILYECFDIQELLYHNPCFNVNR